MGVVGTKEYLRGLVVIGILALAVSAVAGPGTMSSQSDLDAVMAANAGFYAALNAIFTGDIEPMTAVWSHADDVTYMGPTGATEHGWDAVLKDWQGQAAMMLGGHVEPTEIRAVVGSDLAVLSLHEQGENTNAQGQVQRVMLRATNVFRKEGGHWKMIGHHTDTLPYLAQ